MSILEASSKKWMSIPNIKVFMEMKHYFPSSETSFKSTRIYIKLITSCRHLNERHENMTPNTGALAQCLKAGLINNYIYKLFTHPYFRHEEISRFPSRSHIYLPSDCKNFTHPSDAQFTFLLKRH